MFNMKKGSKPYHIFLTGPKHIGKSTLVKQVLDSTDLKTQVLLSTTVVEDGCRKHFLENRLIAECFDNGKMNLFPEVFEQSLNLLDIKPNTQLFVIDEVGFIENNAPSYCKKLMNLLEQTDVHILGVLRQDPSSVLYKAIKGHDNVKTFVIGEANRGNMAPVVDRLLHNIHRD